MLTQEQIESAVQSALPDVLSGLRKEITESALYQAKQTIYAEVNKAITEWVKENVVPDVLTALAESKQGLAAAAVAMAASLTEALGESMRVTVTKKLESSWERKKIFEALIA